MKAPAADGTLEYEVKGRTVRIVTRPAEGDGPARLFEIGSGATWNDESPLTDEDMAAVVRGLINTASRKGEAVEVIGVSPAAALAFPDDPRISVSPVEPFSFSLPGSPSGLALQMDDHGNGHLFALGDERVELGSDGMWWILTRLIDALTDPGEVSSWPRFLTLGGVLGGAATQASLRAGSSGLEIVWRKLESGVVGQAVASHELSLERAGGWVSMLRPVHDDLERQRVHRHRLLPARTAEKWARVLERCSN
ncbi:MAG: hypothetical protein ABSE70_03630 [Candidatus Limnocylindrales bacterium]